MKASLCLAVVAILIPTMANSSSQCRRCDIIDEGLLNDGLVGHYVYEQGESGRFYREVVSKVSVYPPAIYRQLPNGSYSWNEASHFYSESSMREITADANGGTPGYQMTTADQRDRAAQMTACAVYGKALDDGSFITAYVMRGACCDSTVAKRFGAPDICRTP